MHLQIHSGIEFVSIMVGFLALTKQLQYGHLFAQFYGQNAKPTEFGFIVGDYAVYRLFSISLCTTANDESQIKQKKATRQRELKRFSDSKISLRAHRLDWRLSCGYTKRERETESEMTVCGLAKSHFMLRN